MKVRRFLSPAVLATALSFMAASWAAALPVAVAYPGLNNALPAPSPLEEQLLQVIQDDRAAHGKTRLTWDAMTSAIAREQSEDMAKYEYTDYASPRLGTLEYRLHRAGVSAGNSRFAVYRMSSIAALRESFREKAVDLEDATDVGIGIAARTSKDLFLTLIFYEKYSQLDPFPTLPILGEKYLVSGRLDGNLKKAQLVVTTPDGKVTDQPLTLSPSGRFESIVSFDKGPGEYSVEITASARLGPLVVDLMHCYAGVGYPPPTVPPKKSTAPPDLREGVQLMFDLINQARAEAQVPPLTYDERLAETARLHSLDMFENKYFAHDSPTLGNLGARMARAGIQARKFAENIANNQDLAAAHRELMESPGHRMDILDSELTRVGVGIVRAANGQLFVTEDFLADYQTYDTDELSEQLIQALNQLRGNAGVGALAKSSGLTEVALESSRALMAAGKLDTSKAKALVSQRKFRFKNVEIALLESADPAKAGQFTEARKARYQEVGVGIVQENSASGVKTLWTTVLVGER